jgi:hypothetical protein
MTEQQWLDCNDPEPMLEFLETIGTASDRKLRLFVLACCQRIIELLANERCHRALEIAEQCAEGVLSLEESYALGKELELFWNYDLAERLMEETGYLLEACRTALGAVGLIHGWLDPIQASRIARNASTAVVLQIAPHLSDSEEASFEVAAIPFRARENSAQAALLRDIFGNPCRPVSVNPSWLTTSAVSVAKSIYDDRAFDGLPILADALEDAGCTDPDILGHCRGPGPHVRGCWVVDCVLGKE